MKVVQLTRAIYPLHGFGGLEQHVYQLTRHLARLGVEIVVLTSCPPGRSPDWVGGDDLSSLGEGVRVFAAEAPRLPLRRNSVPDRLTNYPWLVSTVGRLARELGQAGQIEVVHTHGLCAFGYGLSTSRSRRSVPMIANPHGMEEFKVTDPLKRLAYAPFRAMYREGARAASRVVATDAAMAGEVVDLLGVDSGKVVILPNAIDADECLGYLSAAEQKRLAWVFGVAEARPLILSVGRLEPNKGFHVMLEALSGARDHLPPSWAWLLVGDGSQRQSLEATIGRLGLADRVRLVGKVPVRELHNLYGLAHIFVHPTLYEGSSIVTLEAMIHGLPVVASNVGGIPDKVLPGLNGYLAGPGDVDDLGRKIVSLVRQPDAWANMGAEGAVIARSRFSWTAVAIDTLAVYGQLVAERAS